MSEAHQFQAKRDKRFTSDLRLHLKGAIAMFTLQLYAGLDGSDILLMKSTVNSWCIRQSDQPY